MEFENIKNTIFSKRNLGILSGIILGVIGNFIYSEISDLGFLKSLGNILTLKLPLYIFLIFILVVVLFPIIIRTRISESQLWIIAFGGFAHRDIPFVELRQKYYKYFPKKTVLDLKIDLDKLRKKDLFKKTSVSRDGLEFFRITSKGIEYLRKSKKIEKGRE